MAAPFSTQLVNLLAAFLLSILSVFSLPAAAQQAGRLISADPMQDAPAGVGGEFRG